MSPHSRLDFGDQLRDLMLNLSNLDLSGQLFNETPYRQANGGFSDIYKATHLTANGNVVVAVKCLRVHVLNDRDASKFVFRELRIWSSLSHHNVVPLLGYIMHGEYPALVSQWLVRGSILSYMAQNPDVSPLSMAKGISAGLLYLHDLDVIHSDLKCDNILVSDAGEPQLTDFGISRIMQMTNMFGDSNSSSGTTRWMAIELLSFDKGETNGTQRHTKETDVWAFGMVVYELLTRKVPYHHIRNEMGVVLTISEGGLPLAPSLTTEDDQRMWQMCQWCWASSAAARPTAVWIYEELCHPQQISKTLDACAVTLETEIPNKFADVLIRFPEPSTVFPTCTVQIPAYNSQQPTRPQPVNLAGSVSDSGSDVESAPPLSKKFSTSKLRFDKDEYQQKIRSYSDIQLEKSMKSEGHHVNASAFSVGAGIALAPFTFGGSFLGAGAAGYFLSTSKEKLEILKAEWARRGLPSSSKA